MLPACTGKTVTALPPPPIVIKIRDTPPADLTACPQPPSPTPPGSVADIPPKVRLALISLALAYRASVDQLTRLITWTDPAHPCPAPPAG